MRKMKRCLALVGTSALVLGMLTGCKGGNAPVEPTEEPPSGVDVDVDLPTDEAEFVSQDGWTVRYDQNRFECNEVEGGASFVYSGECAGTDMLNILVFADQGPQEVLTQFASEVDPDMELWNRSEGYFYDGQWARMASYVDETDSEDSIVYSYTSAEYNGGTILFECIMHQEPDENRGMEISDGMANIMDSIVFDQYDPQEEFSYVPGVYTRTYTEEIGGEEVENTNILELYEDHTGKFIAQDEVPVAWWGSASMQLQDGTQMDYTIEGDLMYLYESGDWREYTKSNE